jgi:hypothetical protein
MHMAAARTAGSTSVANRWCIKRRAPTASDLLREARGRLAAGRHPHVFREARRAMAAPLRMTDAYALFGFPVHHSWSPFIHGMFARQTGTGHGPIASSSRRPSASARRARFLRAAGVAGSTSPCRTRRLPPTSSTNSRRGRSAPTRSTPSCVVTAADRGQHRRRRTARRPHAQSAREIRGAAHPAARGGRRGARRDRTPYRPLQPSTLVIANRSRYALSSWRRVRRTRQRSRRAFAQVEPRAVRPRGQRDRSQPQGRGAADPGPMSWTAGRPATTWPTASAIRRSRLGEAPRRPSRRAGLGHAGRAGGGGLRALARRAARHARRCSRCCERALRCGLRVLALEVT